MACTDRIEVGFEIALAVDIDEDFLDYFALLLAFIIASDSPAPPRVSGHSLSLSSDVESRSKILT